MTIRPAVTSDASAIAALHRASAMTAYREIFPRDEPFTGPGESGWAKQTADEQSIVLVAEGDGVVGFVAAGPSRDPFAGHAVGEGYALYVAPPHWRRGIGSELLERAAALLAERGMGECTLWVLEANAAARAFYERAGWTPDGALKHAAACVTEVRYRRGLTAGRG